MQLGEKQYKVMELIIQGETISDIAKMMKVSRGTIYNWLDDENFKADLNKQRQEIKDASKERINANIGIYIGELHKIATTSPSEKARIEASVYLLNRVLGTPTRVQQDITEDTNKEDNSINIDDIVQGIELKEAK
ncbi:MAG: helix-turn-helix domain-containing protein [Peptostreptococcaceae bacterium]|nr:helix-turn-helix domain-containing protein [Peptostreptococcaceae bacterium]